MPRPYPNPEIIDRILNALNMNPRGLTVTEIANKVDIDRKTAIRYMKRLHRERRVVYIRYGTAKVYTLR